MTPMIEPRLASNSWGAHIEKSLAIPWFGKMTVEVGTDTASPEHTLRILEIAAEIRPTSVLMVVLAQFDVAAATRLTRFTSPHFLMILSDEAAPEAINTLSSLAGVEYLDLSRSGLKDADLVERGRFSVLQGLDLPPDTDPQSVASIRARLPQVRVSVESETR